MSLYDSQIHEPWGAQEGFFIIGPECPGPIYLAGQWLIQHCYWYYYYRVLFERFCQAVSPFPMGSSLIICIRVRRQ